MEYLNPNELKKSIQKYFNKGGNIIDIDIDNINPSFCIDNYKSVNVLRDSNFRREFNSLCKGKTETKNLDEKQVVDNKKIYLCKESQIIDIPFLLDSLFEKPKNYYIFGTPSKFSFYHSILNIVDKEFILNGSIHKEKKIDEYRNDLVYNLDDMYSKNREIYKSKRFKKSTIKENLLNSKVFLPCTINYILDYYDLCLLIIDTETYLFSLGNEFSKEKDFIIMIRKNNYYQPILNINGNNKFNWEVIEKISKILKPEFDFDINLEENNLEEKIFLKKDYLEKSKELNKNEEIKLEKLWKYKLIDLQNIAKKISIDLKKENKNKTKDELYKEIQNKL